MLKRIIIGGLTFGFLWAIVDALHPNETWLVIFGVIIGVFTDRYVNKPNHF
jgi:hypothetical protein